MPSFRIMPVFVLAALLLCAYGKDIIMSGEQDGVFEKAEYLVTKDILVKRGAIITFAAGSIIRFKPYTGMTIEGRLVCNGTPSDPVVFTSDNDRGASVLRPTQPAPFDWNGIDASLFCDTLSLTFAQVSYSTFGINVGPASCVVKLKAIAFVKNGRADFAMAGKPVTIQDNAAFSFESASRPSGDTDLNSVLLAGAAFSPHEAEKPFPWKLAARIGLGTAACAGLGLGLYGHFQADHYYKLSQDPSASYPLPDTYWKKMKDAQALRNAGYIIAAVCAAGFTMTFVF
jgi:hypothetical protein